MLAIVALYVSGEGVGVGGGPGGSAPAVVQGTVVGTSPAPLGGVRGMPVLCSV